MTKKLKSQNKASRTGLLKAPHRAWDKTSSYSAIFIVPTRKKHDSGWMVQAIVGVLPDDTYEVAAWCDDIGWLFKTTSDYCSMRTDCSYPGGILHFWNAVFEVGCSLSSTNIVVTDRVRERNPQPAPF